MDALLGDPYVHDIIAQRETTIDFTKFIEEKRVVLIRLSDRLSTDVKTFIGTILISELVDAVKRRSTLDPHQFCVYVDEFQNFASYDDSSTLITGGGGNTVWRPRLSYSTVFCIVNAKSSLCLGVNQASTANGAQLKQFICDGRPNQFWKQINLGP